VVNDVEQSGRSRPGLGDDAGTVRRPVPRVRAIADRIRMWWRVETAVAELTRDREREERIIQKGARQIAMTPYAIGLLFRPRPPLGRRTRGDR
jgi:hypothetical protein